jgi:hypothetical protein
VDMVVSAGEVPATATTPAATTAGAPVVGPGEGPEGRTPAPVPGTESAFAGRWARELAVLSEMGLLDVEANVAALEAAQGSVARAVNVLFGMGA